jgi:hypothetical protein
MLDLNSFGSVPGLDRGDLGFQLLCHRQALEPDLIATLQYIHTSSATGSGTGVGFQPLIFEEQGIMPSGGGMNAFHRCRGARAVSHTNIF